MHIYSSCFICSKSGFHKYSVCANCRGLFTTLEPICQKFAVPLVRNSPHIHNIISYYAFTEPLRNIIHAFKYHGALHLASFLVELLSDALTNVAHSTVDLLLPMPLHKKKLRERGFNQAAILTKKLSRVYKIPYMLSAANRVLYTSPQANTAYLKRGLNMQRAFTSQNVAGKRIAIIDDIITTGSSANSLAQVLKQQGALSVDVWCCARTLSNIEHQ
jgi:ComF family protein